MCIAALFISVKNLQKPTDLSVGEWQNTQRSIRTAGYYSEAKRSRSSTHATNLKCVLLKEQGRSLACIIAVTRLPGRGGTTGSTSAVVRSRARGVGAGLASGQRGILRGVGLAPCCAQWVREFTHVKTFTERRNCTVCKVKILTN